MALPESREPRDQLAPLDPLVPLDPPALLGLPARLDRRATQESRETSKIAEPEAASVGGLFHFPSTPMPDGRKAGIVATKPGEMLSRRLRCENQAGILPTETERVRQHALDCGVARNVGHNV